MTDPIDDRWYGEEGISLGECLVADSDSRIDGDVVSDLASHAITLKSEIVRLRTELDRVRIENRRIHWE
jgi:hypothetical protein